MDIGSAIAALNGAIGSLRGAKDLIASLRNRRSEEVLTLQEKIAESLDAVLNAKIALDAVREENARLNERIRQLEAEKDQREELILEKIAGGAFVRIPKDAPEAVKEGPWYCQTCFDRDERSVFQFAKRDFGSDRYECPRCGAAVHVPNDHRPTIITGGRRRSADLDGF
jgi:hypothetical protein